MTAGVPVKFQPQILYQDQIYKIMAPILLQPAPWAYQMKGADYLVKAGVKNFKFRKRSPEYLRLYANQVTFRTRAEAGHPTEIHKMVAGNVGYLLYVFLGHPTDPAVPFARWFVLDVRAMFNDLDEFRLAWRSVHPNKGDSTRFMGVDVRLLRPEWVVGSSKSIKFKTIQRSLF